VVLSSSIFKKIAYPGSVRGHAASECACRPSSRRRISFMSSKEPPNLPEGKRRICRIMGCDHEGEQLDFVHFVLRGGEAVLNRNPFYSNVCKTCYPSVFADQQKKLKEGRLLRCAWRIHSIQSIFQYFWSCALAAKEAAVQRSVASQSSSGSTLLPKPFLAPDVVLNYGCKHVSESMQQFEADIRSDYQLNMKSVKYAVFLWTTKAQEPMWVPVPPPQHSASS